MYIKVQPYTDPLDIFMNLGERASELSDVDLGFIGGALENINRKNCRSRHFSWWDNCLYAELYK